MNRDGGGDGQGEGDQVARLTEAVLALEQPVSGMAAVLEQQGHMLRALLELAAGVKDGRLDELLVALIGRLDAHASAMKRVEDGVNRLQNLTRSTTKSIRRLSKSDLCRVG